MIYLYLPEDMVPAADTKGITMEKLSTGGRARVHGLDVDGNVNIPVSSRRPRGRVREVLPKGSPFDAILDEEMRRIDRMLNDRPL